jgi:hypothetical protein
VAESGTTDQVTLDIEGVVDGGVGREKPLGRTLRFETLLLSLTASDRQMRIFGSIVFSQPAGAVTIGTAEFVCCSAIGCQPVSDDCLRMDALVLQKLPEQSQCCLLVPPLLHQHIEDFAFVIDGTPEIHPLPSNSHHHLVQMPAACGTRPGSSKIASEEPTELPCPTADGLIADIDAALGHQVHQVFNITKAQRESEVQPHCLANNVCWKPMASIGNYLHRPQFPMVLTGFKSPSGQISLS